VALRKLAGGKPPVSQHASTMDGDPHGRLEGESHA